MYVLNMHWRIVSVEAYFEVCDWGAGVIVVRIFFQEEEVAGSTATKAVATHPLFEDTRMTPKFDILQEENQHF